MEEEQLLMHLIYLLKVQILLSNNSSKLIKHLLQANLEVTCLTWILIQSQLLAIINSLINSNLQISQVA